MPKGFNKDDDRPPVLPGVALGIPMQLSFEGIGTFKSQLLGMEDGNCTIVKLPPIPEIGTKLYQKNHAIIRYFHKGNVYGFRSTLIGIIKEPVRLFILAYPEAIDSLNVRKDQRYSCLIPACVKDNAPERAPWELQGFVSDISAGGCKFECSMNDSTVRPNFQVGQSVALAFRFTNDDAWKSLAAEIRIVNMDAVKLTIGLRYAPDEAREDQQQAFSDIQAYISTCMIDRID